MFVRLLRIFDRFGRLIVKIGVWSGHRIQLWIDSVTFWLRLRTVEPSLVSESAYVEGQVRSLSGLIVMLLIIVVLVVFWATSPQAMNNPVIRFLAPDTTPFPGDSSGPPLLRSTDSAAAFLTPGGTIVFSMYTGTSPQQGQTGFAGAQQDLFALSAGQSEPVRLTAHPADDCDPAWSPDGQRIAFASHRSGNWDLYILELPSGEITRLTDNPAFEARPTWSPDGQWLAYEGYYEGNLDIYIIRADGSEGPYPVTHHQAPDFAPAWTTSPDGRTLAYVSWREGNQDIYILDLDDPSEGKAVNVTNTATVNETDPAWGPGGLLLAYSARENGVPLVYVQKISEPNAKPIVIGRGSSPTWSPDGSNLIFLSEHSGGSLLLSGQFGSWDASVRAFSLPSLASRPNWAAASLPAIPKGSLAFAATMPSIPLYDEPLWPTEGPDSVVRLINLADVIADEPYLSDRVDSSFASLKEHINQAAGWDFLGRLDQVWWPLPRPSDPGQDFRNWHKAGRAFDVVQSYNQGNPAQIELVPEQREGELYWRLYVRCAVQDGTLGEPLRQFPWDFASRTSGDVQAYEAGGRFKDRIPSGYYVDFTQIAQIYGWTPAPSDISWRYNWPGVLYWQYEKRDGLSWWDAMLELYPVSSIEQVFYTPTPAPTMAVSPTPTSENTPEGQDTPSGSPPPVTPTTSPSPTRTPSPASR